MRNSCVLVKHPFSNFRIVDELLHVRDDFERQKRDMETFYKNQLQTLQQKQTRDIKDHLERGLCLCSSVSSSGYHKLVCILLFPGYIHLFFFFCNQPHTRGVNPSVGVRLKFSKNIVFFCLKIFFTFYKQCRPR